MKTILFIFLILGFCWLVPQADADCLSLGGYSSWVPEGDQKIIFYYGRRPMAAVKLRSCMVSPGSSLRLTKSFICDSDTIVIDGQECNLFSVDSLSL